MSYCMNYEVTANCSDSDTAVSLANELREILCCDSERAEISRYDNSVYMSCSYSDIDDEVFAVLTKQFPGTFITAKYRGEDGEIGVIFAKNGLWYSEPAEIRFPEFNEKLLTKEKTPCEVLKRVQLQSFTCDEELSKYTSSMLYDSGTEIAKAVYVAGDNTLTVTLQVCGEVGVDFKGVRYRAPSEFPDELKARIKSDPLWWSISAPSDEDNDDHESDIYVGMSNWFEAIWEYRGSCDGVVYEQELATSSVDDVKDFLEEVAMTTIGELDADVLKAQMLERAEDLGWLITETFEDVEFAQPSPAGEDFRFCVDNTSPSRILDEIDSFYSDFDAEDHAISAYRMRGAPALRTCLDDADELELMIEELKNELSAIVENWCEEYGIDSSCL